MKERFVEVYAGAYASGKSETAVNRALQFAGEGITLADLDTVEPAYTLRPIRKELAKAGVNIITQPDNFGLGEAANYVTPAQINCLSNSGNIIIDVGYGAGGLDILEIVRGIDKEKNLKIYLVINTAKFETSNESNIIEYAKFSAGGDKKDWKKFSGIISNTHFGDETVLQDIINGYQIVKKASEKLKLPIIAIGADKKFEPSLGKYYDNTEVWFYSRMMPKAFW